MTEHTLTTLTKHIASFKKDDIILVGGDFNAHTGRLIDFIEDDNTINDFVLQPEILQKRKDLIQRKRMNQDKKINKFGRDLRDICISTNMKILNGRTIGDLVGQLTYIGPNGCSTVDYVIGSENAITGKKEIVQKFQVEEINSLSDHRPLSLNLSSITGTLPAEDNASLLLKSENRKRKLSYNPTFENLLNTTERKTKLNNLTAQIKDLEDKNAITSSLNELENMFAEVSELIQPCDIPVKLKGSQNKIRNKKKKYQKKEPWYSAECRKLKRNIDYTCKALSKNPQNPYIRGNFFKLKKEYKKLTKQTKLKFDQKIVEELENSSTNKNDFWKKYKNITGNKLNAELPNPNDMQEFFKELYSETNNLEDISLPEKNDIVNEGIIKDEISNKKTNIKEIKEHIQNLKNNKATGNDRIMNEMLKASNDETLQLLDALFNRILVEGKYPANWNTSLTQLIYKEGARDESTNYRGISLSSNLGKLFNSILEKRIDTYLEINKLIRREQGGFRKGYRTSDHIFVLQTLIQKYTQNGGKLYGCFVDLKKAYDSVWRRGLMHKLENIGINQKTIRLIEDMYNETYTSLIYKKHILPEIQTRKGLKQGDNLSPKLFNIYINDLPEDIEKGETHPVRIHNLDINCLMWADDIILLSETKEGLQNCLNNLSSYCKKWRLEINPKKTKSIIFREKGTKITNNQFNINTVPIEMTREYTYLGISINTSGNQKIGCLRLLDKARRAWFSILRILWKSKYRNTDTYVTLFDHVIKPIALYSCEVWGAEENSSDKIENLHSSACELFQTRCCKHILGASKKTTNMATLAELGRYPLYIDIHKKMVKYFLRLNTLNTDRILYLAYLEQKNELIKNGATWLTKIKDILDHTGFSFVYTPDIGVNTNETNTLADEIQKRSREIFEQRTRSYLDEREKNLEGKLVFYSKVKHRYKKEAYLQIQNIKNRSAIRNMRISTHKLNIETGRHMGISRNERLCDVCDLKTAETEEHFLIDCPIYAKERISFMCHNKLNEKKNPNKMNLNTIIKIMTSDDIWLLNKFGRYIRTCLDKRKQTKEKKRSLTDPAIP